MFKIFFIGIDIGTSSTKGVLVNKDGNVIYHSKRNHTVNYKTANQAEQNPDNVWWNETLSIIKELVKNSNIPKERIAGVGCSGMFPVILPVDKKGQPLREGILYNIDTRSKKQIDYIQTKIDKYYMTENIQNNLTYQSVIPKIKWIKDNEPEVWEKTQTILDPRGYIVFKLTGKKVIDHYTAFNNGFGYSSSEYNWSKTDFEIAEIDPSIMPEIKWSYEIAGYINLESARITGLLEGTPVITGTGDALAEMLSAGVYKTKDTVLLYGSTMPVMTIKDNSPHQDKYLSAPSWTKNKSIISAGIRSGMISFSWLKNLTGYQTTEELFLQMKNLEKIKASEEGLFSLPYFTSQIDPKNDLQKKASFLGLSHHHGSQHLLKALIEGIGFSLRFSMEDYPDIPIIRAIGGGSQSSFLLQTISDICNVEQQTVLNSVGAPLGSAWLTGYGLGILEESSLEDWVKKENIYLPNKEKNLIYEDIYRDFKKILNQSINYLDYNDNSR